LHLRFQRKLQAGHNAEFLPFWPSLEPTLALDCSLSETDGKPAAPVKRAMRRGHC